MSTEPTDQPPSTGTPQQDAAKFALALDELDAAVHEDDCRLKGTEPDRRAVHEYVAALICDAASLAQGISNGTIRMSQPRIATNLIAVFQKLNEFGHGESALRVLLLIREISASGLAAEGCLIGRNRPGLAR